MDITGKIIAVLPLRSGVSARGNQWQSQEYVIETQEQYPKRCCFNVFGEDKIKGMAIAEGQTLIVSFDIDAREYKGRWYNQVNAWKVEHIGAQQNTQQTQQNTQQQAVQQPTQQAQNFPPQVNNNGAPVNNGGGQSDDLPF